MARVGADSELTFSLLRFAKLSSGVTNSALSKTPGIAQTAIGSLISKLQSKTMRIHSLHNLQYRLLFLVSYQSDTSS